MDFFKHKKWQLSLIPLNVGTIIKWNTPRVGLTQSTSIKVGTFMKVVDICDPLMGKGEVQNYQKIYVLCVCTKNGVVFKKDHRITVEGIAERIEKGLISIVTQVDLP